MQKVLKFIYERGLRFGLLLLFCDSAVSSLDAFFDRSKTDIASSVGRRGGDSY